MEKETKIITVNGVKSLEVNLKTTVSKEAIEKQILFYTDVRDKANEKLVELKEISINLQ